MVNQIWPWWGIVLWEFSVLWWMFVISTFSVGKIPVVHSSDSISVTPLENPEVLPGGRWAPEWCSAYYRLAVIIPYRDRKVHLDTLLHHLHPILQKQLQEYQIFVVEQVSIHFLEILNFKYNLNEIYLYIICKVHFRFVNNSKANNSNVFFIIFMWEKYTFMIKGLKMIYLNNIS